MATTNNAPTDSCTKEDAFSLITDFHPNSALGKTLKEWMESPPNRSVFASAEMESLTEDDTSLNVRFSPAMPMFINSEESTPEKRPAMDLTLAQIKPRRVPPTATITRPTDADDYAQRLSLEYDKGSPFDELKKKPALADDEIMSLSSIPLQESNEKLSSGVQLRETAVFHGENSESLQSYDERTTSAEASSTGQSIGPVTNAIKPPQSGPANTMKRTASLTGQEIGPVTNAIKPPQSGTANTMKRKYDQSIGIQSMIVKGPVPKKAKPAESKLAKVPTQMVLQSKPSTSKAGVKHNVQLSRVPINSQPSTSKAGVKPTVQLNIVPINSKPSTSKAGVKPTVQLNTVPVRMTGNGKKGKSAAPAQMASHSATSKAGVNASASSDPANMKRKNVANTRIKIPLNHPNVATTRETGIPLKLRQITQNLPGITIKPVGAATYDPALYNYIKILERNGVTVTKINSKKKTNIQPNVKNS